MLFPERWGRASSSNIKGWEVNSHRRGPRRSILIVHISSIIGFRWNIFQTLVSETACIISFICGRPQLSQRVWRDYPLYPNDCWKKHYHWYRSHSSLPQQNNAGPCRLFMGGQLWPSWMHKCVESISLLASTRVNHDRCAELDGLCWYKTYIAWEEN